VGSSNFAFYPKSASGNSSPNYAIGVVTQLPPGANYPLYAEYPTGPLFVRMRVSNSGHDWTSPGVNAQQALSMISQMKPQVLERMTSNVFSLNWDVPVCSGCSPMTFGQFLNASMDACQCFIIPRIDINATWDSGTFTQDAQKILDMPLSPRFSILSIDDWGPFCSSHTCNCSLDNQIFQPLYAMGWKGVGILSGDPYPGSCGWATYATLDINGNTWQIKQPLLDSIKADPTVQKILMYDPDFPDQANTLLNTCGSSSGGKYYSCDQIASAITYAAQNQQEYNYTYVYPIEQSIWDVTNMFTSNGTSIYDVMLGLMNAYNSLGAPTSTTTLATSSTATSSVSSSEQSSNDTSSSSSGIATTSSTIVTDTQTQTSLTTSTSTQVYTTTSTQTVLSSTWTTVSTATTLTTSYTTITSTTLISTSNTTQTLTTIETSTTTFQTTFPTTLTVIGNSNTSSTLSGESSSHASKTTLASTSQNGVASSTIPGVQVEEQKQLHSANIRVSATTAAFGTSALVFFVGLFPLLYVFEQEIRGKRRFPFSVLH
jgi:hypothetical protein